MRGKTPTNFVQPNCIMQFADSVSVAKIKIIYASRQRTLIWRSCAFNRRPMTMPVLDGVKPMAITLPICGTSKSLFWKRKKMHILLDSVETNLNIWRVRWPSPRQVRVQIPTSPRQVRDDRKTSRVRNRTRVLQPYRQVLINCRQMPDIRGKPVLVHARDNHAVWIIKDAI